MVAQNCRKSQGDPEGAANDEPLSCSAFKCPQTPTPTARQLPHPLQRAALPPLPLLNHLLSLLLLPLLPVASRLLQRTAYVAYPYF